MDDKDIIEQLAASGQLSRGQGDILDLGPPLEPTPGMPLPSEVLEQLRAEERESDPRAW
ncbi:MAG: hypothetical protein ACR2GA_00250 [Chloroflexota bacterium]